MVNFSIIFDGEDCTISKLYLSKDEKIDIPIQYKKVKHLFISDSTIPRFTEEILEAFPNIETLTASSIGIEEVGENSFVNSKNLSSVDLSENNIKVILKNTFNRNTNLTLIDLCQNQLVNLASDLLLNLEKLTLFDISRNNLRILPNKLFQHLKNLTLTYVNGNQLIDLKVEAIVKDCPELKIFGLNDNDFSLSALKKIQTGFKAVGVDYKMETRHKRRDRSYRTKELDGILYIPDSEIEKIVKQKLVVKEQAIKDQPENTKVEQDVGQKIDLLNKKVDFMEKKNGVRTIGSTNFATNNRFNESKDGLNETLDRKTLAS